MNEPRLPAHWPELQALGFRLEASEKVFVAEYAIDWDATRAAVCAGHPPSIAGHRAVLLVANVVVKAALVDELARAAQRATPTCSAAAGPHDQRRAKLVSELEAGDARRGSGRIEAAMPTEVDDG